MRRDKYLTYVPKVKWRDEPRVVTGEDQSNEFRVIERW